MKARYIIPSVLVVILLFSLYKQHVDNAIRSKTAVTTEQITFLIKSKILSEQIRTGQISNALECLEAEIDSGLISLSTKTNQNNVEVEKEIMDTLAMLKEYRDKYPRKIEAVIKP